MVGWWKEIFVCVIFQTVNNLLYSLDCWLVGRDRDRAHGQTRPVPEDLEAPRWALPHLPAAGGHGGPRGGSDFEGWAIQCYEGTWTQQADDDFLFTVNYFSQTVLIRDRGRTPSMFIRSMAACCLPSTWRSKCALSTWCLNTSCWAPCKANSTSASCAGRYR